MICVEWVDVEKCGMVRAVIIELLERLFLCVADREEFGDVGCDFFRFKIIGILFGDFKIMS